MKGKKYRSRESTMREIARLRVMHNPQPGDYLGAIPPQAFENFAFTDGSKIRAWIRSYRGRITSRAAKINGMVFLVRHDPEREAEFSEDEAAQNTRATQAGTRGNQGWYLLGLNVPKISFEEDRDGPYGPYGIFHSEQPEIFESSVNILRYRDNHGPGETPPQPMPRTRQGRRKGHKYSDKIPPYKRTVWEEIVRSAAFVYGIIEEPIPVDYRLGADGEPIPIPEDKGVELLKFWEEQDRLDAGNPRRNIVKKDEVGEHVVYTAFLGGDNPQKLYMTVSKRMNQTWGAVIAYSGDRQQAIKTHDEVMEGYIENELLLEDES